MGAYEHTAGKRSKNALRLAHCIAIPTDWLSSLTGNIVVSGIATPAESLTPSSGARFFSTNHHAQDILTTTRKKVQVQSEGNIHSSSGSSGHSEGKVWWWVGVLGREREHEHERDTSDEHTTTRTPTQLPYVQTSNRRNRQRTLNTLLIDTHAKLAQRSKCKCWQTLQLPTTDTEPTTPLEPPHTHDLLHACALGTGGEAISRHTDIRKRQDNR